jgi:hypothetical protein
MDPGSPLELCALCMWDSVAADRTTGPLVLRERTGGCRSRIHDTDYKQQIGRKKIEMPNLIRVGIDAHKKNCTTCVFDNNDSHEVLGSPTNTFVFNTTREGVREFMQKVPENSIVVIETSTTGLGRHSQRCFQADTRFTLSLRMKEDCKSKRIEGTLRESSKRTRSVT